MIHPSTLDALRAPVRPLPIALAQQLALTRPKDPRLALLNSIYMDLSPADKLRCQGELYECRRARRALLLAQVAP